LVWPGERIWCRTAMVTSPTSSVPQELWSLICEHLRPCDVISAACVCRDLEASALSDALWDELLSQAARAATVALAGPRGISVDQATVDVVRGLALSKGVQTVRGQRLVPLRAQYFHALPHIATAAAAALKEKAPTLCFISFAWRAYDTTDFVEQHPGGPQHMQRHHGRDATPIFNAFPHSPYAHNLMLTRMLRFDAVEHAGRYGAPAFARQALPRSWGLVHEATASLADCRRDLSWIWETWPWKATPVALSGMLLRALVPSTLFVLMRMLSARDAAITGQASPWE